MFFFLKPIKWAIKSVFMVIFGLVAYVVVSAVQVVMASGAAPAATAGAIVVPGSTAAGQGSPDADLVARLQGAVDLFKAKVAPTIVVVGPASTTGASVPSSAEGWLTSAGVPASAIRAVASSNASEFSAVAATIGTSAPVIIVTDAVDALWSRSAAAAAGLQASVAAAPGSKVAVVNEVGSLIREATGIAAGRIIGYHNASWAAS
jgi:vancomycin permeability regulator SanA